MSKQSAIMTQQAMAIGVALFLVLTTVAYIVFPVIFQGQIEAIQSRLDDHVHQDAHAQADVELSSMENRVVALESSAARTDSSFVVPAPFVPTDSLTN